MSIIANEIMKFLKENVEAKHVAWAAGIALWIKKLNGPEAATAVEKLKEFKQGLEDAKATKEDVEKAKETVDKGLTTAETAVKAGDATRKGLSLSSALNPVAAGLALAQEFVISLAKKEVAGLAQIKEVLPSTIDKMKKFIGRQTQKIDEAIAEYEHKKKMKENRKG